MTVRPGPRVKIPPTWKFSEAWVIGRQSSDTCSLTVGKMPRLYDTVSRRILAHWGDLLQSFMLKSAQQHQNAYTNPYTVGELNTSDLERLEQCRDGLVIWLRINCGTSRRILSRSEKWDVGRSLILDSGNSR